MSEFLLEIYSEEIPANLQDKICRPLSVIFCRELKNLGISSDIIVDISSCRIFIYSYNLEFDDNKQLAAIRGPALNCSQQATEGFLKKNNISSIDLLEQINGYYYYKPILGQISLANILSRNLSKILDLSVVIWPRRMRWNESKKEWIRPIRNILCLFDGKTVEFNYAGLISNNITFGNKNITNKAKISVDTIGDYFEKLKQNFVIAKRKDRLNIIESSLRSLEKEKNISVKLDRNRSLLNEVAGLSEYPIMACGIIPDCFFDVPTCIIEQKIKNDQKYFVSYDEKGLTKTVAMFIECNYDKINYVLQGNMRVLNARLSDAQFFYQQDIKMFAKYPQINDEVVKILLSEIPINEKLGNLYDRSIRIKNIMENLSQIGGKDILGGLDLNTIALHLKLDMATNAYKEFPDLQGYIGSEYATKIWGISMEYSDLFAAQHGINVGYGEHVPAIANAIEYVASHLYIGSEFTSSSDPFAIERSINLISSIYEWVPCVGLHVDAVKAFLPKIFEPIANKLSEILIKSAKKINIKRLKNKFKDYLYIDDVCDYYFNLKITYFEAQNSITKALDWLNISEDSAIVLPIYKRCKNISNGDQKEKIKLTIIEWGQINDLLDLLDVAIVDTVENYDFTKIKWNAFSIDLERYFNHYKISDSFDRMIFIKNICSRIEQKHPFLVSISQFQQNHRAS